MSFIPLKNDLDVIAGMLPPSARLAKLPDGSPACISTDVDGDGFNEIIAVYIEQGDLYISVFKQMEGAWRRRATEKGNGADLTHLFAAPLASGKAQTIILGWHIGNMWSELSLMQWREGTLKDAIARGILFSKLEVEDMPSTSGKDDIDELAIWVHDSGEAYKIAVYRLGLQGLVMAEDVYPYYFRKVIGYYEELLEKLPQSSIYWYYLADAQRKAGLLRLAIQSIDHALSLPNPYPSKEELMKLRQKLQTEATFIPIGVFRNIRVRRIAAGHYSVSGEANVLEGIVGYEVLEKQNPILQSYTKASAGGPAWGTFSIIIHIKEKPITAYALLLFEPNGSAEFENGISALHSVTIPLTASR